MKKHQIPNRRAVFALIPVAVMLAGPALAQEVQTAPPPPVAAAPPPVQAFSPPRIVQTVPDAVPAPVAEAPVAARPVATPRTTRRVASAATRPRVSQRVSVPAPVAVAPVETPAPVAAPIIAPEPVAPPAAVNPAPQIDRPVETTTTAANTAPVWPLVAGGILLVVALAAFMLRRRRRADEDEYYEEGYVEQRTHDPVVSPVVLETEPQFLRPAATVAAAPLAVDDREQIASEDAALAKADVDDVAELTTADAPVANRPWLEFAMRPIRAGTNVDEALVEIELTIGNSGSIAAKDVRVSTFMFASEPGGPADTERMLLERGDDNSVPPVTIAPGEGARVDATLALPRPILGWAMAIAFRRSSSPTRAIHCQMVAEGRTSASFRIGVSDVGGAAMMPFPIDTRAMRDDVEAELYGVPEHA